MDVNDLKLLIKKINHCLNILVMLLIQEKMKISKIKNKIKNIKRSIIKSEDLF